MPALRGAGGWPGSPQLPPEPSCSLVPSVSFKQNPLFAVDQNRLLSHNLETQSNTADVLYLQSCPEMSASLEGTLGWESGARSWLTPQTTVWPQANCFISVSQFPPLCTVDNDGIYPTGCGGTERVHMCKSLATVPGMEETLSEVSWTKKLRGT